jgi:exopolyphosphatase/guanosine-5'-triphosphate,3'-diphosphate pyrophosphatase
MKKNIAAIDIGTNSIHLAVVSGDLTKNTFKILDREHEMVRLGSGSTDMKYLSAGAISRAIKTLHRYRAIADTMNARVRAVGTSAVREALNQKEFIERVRAETGIEVEVVSGYEEARLIYTGVLQALPLFDKRVLLIDIGGGSTEFLVGERREIFYSNSLKLGAVRLTERFFAEKKKYSSKAIRKCSKYISGMLNPPIRDIKGQNYDVVVGSSGTIENIAQMIRVNLGNRQGTKLNGFEFTREELYTIVDKLVRAKTPENLLKMPGLDKSRADIIIAGALVLRQIFEELSIKRMVVSEFALREGIVFDTIEKKSSASGHKFLANIRYRSIVSFAEHFNYERQHAQQTSMLALKLFDQLQQLHLMKDADREYLHYAALLHDLGMFLSHTQHHRHSYYLIRNSELPGFTENEKEIIANIARYHRKSHPKLKHEGFKNLNPREAKLVAKLSALLRIADGLDRAHAAAVRDIKCRVTQSTVACTLMPVHDNSLAIEIWGADRKKQLFEETFGKKVVFKKMGSARY